MSVTPNFCCDETKNWGAYTRLTSMVPWLGFNLAETTSAQKRSSAAGAQLSEAPGRSGAWRKPSAGEGPWCLKPGQWKMNSAESPRSSVSDSRRPPVKVGGPRCCGWSDITNKILTPLQSLVSCFLEPSSNLPANRWAAVSTTEGLWRGYFLVCPKGTICWATVTVIQADGVSSVPTLLCAKNQANGNCEHRSDI